MRITRDLGSLGWNSEVSMWYDWDEGAPSSSSRAEAMVGLLLKNAAGSSVPDCFLKIERILILSMESTPISANSVLGVNSVISSPNSATTMLNKTVL